MNSEALKNAAQQGDIDGLYGVIQQDPHVLHNMDSIPFVETPLHVAATAGHLQFSVEIMTLKTSFALKLNLQGFSPIHLALQQWQMQDGRSVTEQGYKRFVLRLVDINKDLIRVKGKGGLTPLHLLTSQTNDQTNLLKKFLETCPDSIQDVTTRNETAVHIAVKHRKYEALLVLIGWLTGNTQEGAKQLKRTILNWKDDEGNTILHVATLNNDRAVTALLKKNYMIDLDAKNLEGKTAMDIAAGNQNIRRTLERGATARIIVKLKSIVERFTRILNLKHISEGERNAYLVVATLIATATYQAALSPPGGLYQTNAETNLSDVSASNHSIDNISTTGNKGNSIMTSSEFTIFSCTNMGCFVASTNAIFFLLPSRNFVAFILLYLPTLLLQFSYLLAMIVISPSSYTQSVVSESFIYSIMVWFSIPLVLGALKILAVGFMRFLPAKTNLTEGDRLG